MRIRTVVIIVVLAILATALTVYAGTAGSLEPADPPGSTSSYTLEDIYRRLDTGAATTQSTFTEPGSGPGTGTMHTLNDVMAIAPSLNDRSGATAADVVSGKTFWGLTVSGWGLQTGTAATNPDPPCFDNTNRYADCGNGTVHDQATNLIWTKDATCWNIQVDYATANNLAAGLEDGDCGLTDGSSPGDWRLPTKEEWEATVAEAVRQNCTYPALTNIPGTDCFDVGPEPFFSVHSTYLRWSSTANDQNPNNAWAVAMSDGNTFTVLRTGTGPFAWPVRGP